MEKNAHFIFAGFNHDAALKYAYKNSDEEIGEMLNTMDEQQVLSFYTYLQELGDQRKSRIIRIMINQMDCVQRTISGLSFGMMNKIPENLKMYSERCIELGRLQNLMQKRVDGILAEAKAKSVPLFRKG